MASTRASRGRSWSCSIAPPKRATATTTWPRSSPHTTGKLPRAVDESKKGKTYAPFAYEVGLEKIREYANAVGEAERVHHDRDAAREAGFRDVVAPPLSAVVYAPGARAPAILDPELGMDLARMLHGSQEFV